MALVEFGNLGPVAALDDIVDHLVTSEDEESEPPYVQPMAYAIGIQCLWHMPLSLL